MTKKLISVKVHHINDSLSDVFIEDVSEELSEEVSTDIRQVDTSIAFPEAILNLSFTEHVSSDDRQSIEQMLIDSVKFSSKDFKAMVNKLSIIVGVLYNVSITIFYVSESVITLTIG